MQLNVLRVIEQGNPILCRSEGQQEEDMKISTDQHLDSDSLFVKVNWIEINLDKHYRV